MLCFLNTGHVIYNTLQYVGKCFFPISSYLRAYLRMNRNWVKFPWDLYWEKKTNQIKRSICTTNKRDSGAKFTSPKFCLPFLPNGETIGLKKCLALTDSFSSFMFILYFWTKCPCILTIWSHKLKVVQFFAHKSCSAMPWLVFPKIILEFFHS